MRYADDDAYARMEGTGAGSATPRSLRFQSDDYNQILFNVLTSRQCLWQLLLTTIICSGVHVLFTWGQLSNWNDHRAVAVCLFRWSHPAGYSAMGTSLAEAMPIDATLTAFFTCLGAMKRMGDVQRGWAPFVPPDALHRGPLWLLFPRGAASLPHITSLLGVTVVWGCLWGGLCVTLLSMTWALRGSLCLSGWQYIAARACWSTSEAVMVSAGSYLLWCSKSEDLASRSLVERARLRREADDTDARKAAATFGVFQTLNAIVAVALIILALWLVLFGCGAVSPLVWIASLAVGGASLLVALLGVCLNRYHRRDEQHAAKTMRPGVLLGLYLTLLMATALAAGLLGSISLTSVPSTMEFLLQNWNWAKTRALPFSEPLETAQSTANSLTHVAVAAICLASIQALALINACSMLSRRGALALVPFALHTTALGLSAACVAVGFVYGPVACLVSPIACVVVRTVSLCALLLLLLCLLRLFLDPAERFWLFLVPALGLLAAFLTCAIESATLEQSAVTDVGARWEHIELVLPARCATRPTEPSGPTASAAMSLLAGSAPTCPHRDLPLPPRVLSSPVLQLVRMHREPC